MFLLTAVAGDARVDLKWVSPSTKAKKFRIKRASPPGSGPLTLTNPAITDTQYTDTVVSNGREYGYFVVALTSSGAKIDESNYVTVTPKAASLFDLPAIVGYGSGVTGGGSAIPQKVTTIAQYIEALQDSGSRVIYGDGAWLFGSGQTVAVTHGDLTVVNISTGKIHINYKGASNTRHHNIRNLPNGATGYDEDGLTVNGQSTTGVPVEGFAASNGWYLGGSDMGGAGILGEVFDITLQHCVFGPGLEHTVGDTELNHNRILNYTTFGSHAAGPWGKRQTTFECLVWGGEDRNPDIKYVEGVDFIRNMIYNFRESPNGNPRGLNYMYNRVRTGPESNPTKAKTWEGQVKPDETPFAQSVYTHGNVADGFPFAETFANNTQRSTPFSAPSVTATAAPTVEEILTSVGPTTGFNSQEQRLIDHARNRTSDGYYTGVGMGTPNLTWPTNP